jgi:hypothetical protein
VGGAGIRQLALSMVPARMGIYSHVRRAAVPNKGVFYLHCSCINILIHNVHMCVFDIKRKYPPVQVKNKPRVGESEPAYILGSVVNLVANTNHA